MDRRKIWIPEGPVIYVPRTIEAEIVLPGPRYEGFVTVERFFGDHRKGVKTGHWEFRNHIVNGGLDLIFLKDGQRIDTALSHMAVGTGSTAPADGQTGLVAEIAPANTNRTSSSGLVADVTGFGPSFTYAYLRRTRLFLEAQGNGNLAEMGWFTAVTAGTMFSRMLFKDGGGSPTTITKTAADQLRVTYEIRIYPPVADVTGTISISAVSYDYTIRPANTDSFWGVTRQGSLGSAIGSASDQATGAAFETQTLDAQTGEPAGASTGCSLVTWSAYTGGTFLRDAEYRWDPGVANYALGIGSFRMYGGFEGGNHNALFQMSVTPRFAKDNTKRLNLTMRHTWGRYP